ncbi:hypothetical protein [Mesorhizobium sp. CU3]|uniref:hypothetical protein n=1 Tax=Mesorhizobium sp. CU3 TaxID=2589984 RepID=UPI00112A0658|nr:hypothetical protein [Mesorhizobium sp. CU3]
MNTQNGHGASSGRHLAYIVAVPAAFWIVEWPSVNANIIVVILEIAHITASRSQAPAEPPLIIVEAVHRHGQIVEKIKHVRAAHAAGDSDIWREFP